MSTTKDTWKNKHTVICSLKAPKSLAIRPSGDKKGQQYRSVFMRDRDRILYSKSFRRLSGKTQVYLSGSDDHKRTRLTHTLEVAQIAKTIANNLKLDLDLTEAIALGHDIGHAPFGHAGERILHEIITPTTGDKPLINSTPMKVNLPKKSLRFCGFKHNLQSVLVALELEKDYDEYGLDLTNFTLYGMYSHSSKIYKKGKHADQLHYYDRFDKYLQLADSSTVAWSFEAFVVREADEIAQRHHDLEDAIRGNLISKEEVVNQLENHFGVYIKNGDRKTLKKMKHATDDELYISLLSRLIVNLLVTRITKCSIYNMNKFIIENKLSENKFATYMLNHTPSDAENLISYDCIDDNYSHFKNDMKQFANFISTKVLSSYDIQTADAHGQYIIRKIFQAYFKTPTQLPDHCIIEYYTHIDNSPFVEIPKIISEKGMGEIRSQFSKDFSENLNENELFVLMRVICNQIAGMTDAYAQKTYNSLYS